MMKPKIFIPIFGSYYHFINESAVGLHKMLEIEGLLESRDCFLWYQGAFSEIVQLFSANPIINMPIIKPYVRDGSSIAPGVKTLKHIRLETPESFEVLIPMVRYISCRIPLKARTPGITIVKREKKRVYRENDELAALMQDFDMPVHAVQFETLPFTEQVNLMRNTLIFISPHGAGTMNQIFMPPGGLVVELFPKGYFNWHAKAVANCFRHKFIEVESKHEGEIGRTLGKWSRWIETNGWPDRDSVRRSRRDSDELLRIVRDVKTYSIDPITIHSVVEKALLSK